MKQNGRMIIGEPDVLVRDGRARLQATITFPIDQRNQILWVEVDEKYGKYLCRARADPFLVALLPIAMRNGWDIECKAPIDEILLYQLKEYLIPSLNKGDKRLYATRIFTAETVQVFETGCAVGTGMSGGIDSLYTIKKGLEQQSDYLKLTHVTMFNVGAFYKKEALQFDYQRRMAERLANENGLELVVVDSNFTLYEFPYKLRHIFTHSYNAVLAILSLRKLWRVYYYSSSYDFTYFSLKNNSTKSADHYDLLFWDVMTLPGLRFYNAGGGVTRYEKTKELLDCALAHKYLNVCVDESGANCGVCPKCRRTLVSLDALMGKDEMNDFGMVFDIQKYRKTRRRHLWWLARQMFMIRGDKMVGEVYAVLKHDIPFIMIVFAFFVGMLDNLYYMFRLLGRYIYFHIPIVRRMLKYE